MVDAHFGVGPVEVRANAIGIVDERGVIGVLGIARAVVSPGRCVVGVVSVVEISPLRHSRTDAPVTVDRQHAEVPRPVLHGRHVGRPEPLILRAPSLDPSSSTERDAFPDRGLDHQTAVPGVETHGLLHEMHSPLHDNPARHAKDLRRV